MFNRFILLALVGAFLSGCGFINPIGALNKLLSDRGYVLHNNIPYGEAERQTMDMYFSKAPEAQLKPTIVFVLGGAWRSGNKQDYKFIAHALTGLGHHVLIPNYRLYPEVMFPAFVYDVALAMKEAEVIAEKLNGEGIKRFILMGHSAGAHTAALLSSQPSYLQAVNSKAEVSGLIAIAGPYDLDLEDPEVMPVFSPFATPENAKITRQDLTDMPDVLLIHGKKDMRVGVHHAQKLIAALKDADNIVEYKLYDKATHASVIVGLAQPLRFISDSFSDIQDFLQRF